MLHINRNFAAYLDAMNVVTVLVPKSYFNGEMQTFTLGTPYGERHPLTIERKVDLGESVKYECLCPIPIEIGREYLLYDHQGEATDLQIGAVVRTAAFDEQFFYDGDLGVVYTKKETTFRVWAPTATEAKVKLVQPQTNEVDYIPLKRLEKGVWTATVCGDLEGMYYTYVVCVNKIWREAVDPYAVAVSVNGEYGVIVDLAKTRTEKPPLPPLSSPTDAIIYEMHIRDFTIHPDSGVVHKGKYLGLTELNTKGPNHTTTGLSYLKELGITHVELLPFNDFAGIDERDPLRQYNWGYNPVHYNAPEGSYATDPTDPYARICELKRAIHTLQEYGIRVIMDVVYNHVYIREQSSFEKIVPGYYFRYDEYGNPANGTGVGNDIASERKMVRKWIVDSVRFWAEEYHVDGFRFDLMGILDIETMKAVRETIDALDPFILVFGEGWDLPTPLPSKQKATMHNAEQLPRIGYFNDYFRDSVKGSTFQLLDRGFALGNCDHREKVKVAISGSIRKKGGMFLHPLQTVNYVECHDNHTFWDKMEAANGHENEQTRKKRQKLATAIVLLSQGIPFLHSGQEFYRTKQGIDNSYNAPDSINQIDWVRKSEHEDDIRYIQGLIELRKSHRAFRFSTDEEINHYLFFLEPMPPSIIAYHLRGVEQYGPWRDIVVIHHNQEERQDVFLPDEDKWYVLCDEVRSGTAPLFSVQKKISVDGIGTWVLVKQM
ncbi:type I pullulanase [Parageobacillus sp. VR-IP]|uniref:type I pullulanase n=1 Tax=Parageobacillus sp. VR-IP TaxID=2742205 RepID=UPI001582280E|nr:type I pullulanase [Parageobacillus sp. VR-IP]NUK30574.1 type I pullulanase [Parageobacillus sp. VR-IP]